MTMKTSLAFECILSLILVLSLCALGQPEEVWSRNYGGQSSDPGGAVKTTYDGGYVLTGTTYSYGLGRGDLWLVKTDSNGTEQWNKTFGGRNFDIGRSVQQTSDGGFILTGYTKANLYQDNPISKVLLSKVAGNGTEEWRKEFDGKSSSGTNEGQAVLQTVDGGYIVAGDTTAYGDSNGDALVIKTDPKGNAQWIRPFEGQGSQSADSIQVVKSGGYVIAGNTNRPGGFDIDIWLMKLK